MGDVEFQGGSIGRALAKKNCFGPNLGRFCWDSHRGVQIRAPKRHASLGVKAGDQNA